MNWPPFSDLVRSTSFVAYNMLRWFLLLSICMKGTLKSKSTVVPSLNAEWDANKGLFVVMGMRCKNKVQKLNSKFYLVGH